MNVFQKRRTALLTGICGGAFTLMMAMPALSADVTQERLENATSEPQNWLLPYGNYQGHMFSRLDQINRDTVQDLGVAFTLPVQSAAIGNPDLNLMNHGLVDEGFLFIDDGHGGIYKIDLNSGDSANVLWKADAAVSPDESNRSRGMSFWGNAVYHNLTDGRVVAVDRESGEFLWDVQVARTEHPKGSGVNIEGEYFDASPLPIEGKLLVGQSYGDGLTRGFLAAVDAESGEEVWRTYMVPGPGEPGHETWKDANEVWRIGGAGLWTTGTYDPEQRLTIWGTGNAQPMFDVEYRPGDNLFTGSAVAMNVDDGTIKWYFQYTPNEGWDYDENGVHQIYDVEIDGEQRKVIGHWARNGFFYRLDGTTGEFIDATQYVAEVNWTTGIDAKTGKPVEYDPNLDVQTYVPESRMMRGDPEESFCPTWLGGVRWQSVAYNPDSFTSYSAAFDGCSIRPVAEARPLPGSAMLDPDAPGGIRGAIAGRHTGAHGLVAAVDVRTNEMKARTEMPYESQSGVLATGGGLIFTAFVDGRVSAFNDESLEEVWHFNTGATTKAPPFTFQVGDRQYLAILAGGGRQGSGYSSVWPEAANWVNGPVLYFFAL
jgi:alcohol dehydrogenase (cytochrome c)